MTNEKIFKMAKKVASEKFECEVELVTTEKINGKKEGFMVKRKSESINPIIYFEEITKSYGDHELSEGEIYNVINNMIQSCKKISSPNINPISSSANGDVITPNKDRIYYALMNKERNKELLEKIVSLDFLDLSIFFYIQLDRVDGYNAEIKITKDMLEKSGLDINELYEIAYSNIKKNCSVIIQGLDQIIPIPDENNFLYAGILKGTDYGATILSLLSSINFPADFGDVIYIIPSSIREIIIVDSAMDQNMLEKTINIIKEINCSDAVGEDYLSDSLYVYDIKNKTLKIVAA